MPPSAHVDPQPRVRRRAPRSISMHADVELWCDCCSCEPEPRWQAMEDEADRPATATRERADASEPAA